MQELWLLVSVVTLDIKNVVFFQIAVVSGPEQKLLHCKASIRSKSKIEYGQEIPQSHDADQHIAS